MPHRTSPSPAPAGPRLLDAIQGPADVKALAPAQLPQLAQEIREELIAVTARNGGHIGPNLGVVELTVALHRVFDSPRDAFVFDVAHQGYVHKLLTGRGGDFFRRLRQSGGASGFLTRGESPHDAFGAGHAGTALSAALGMATARDLRGSAEHVVAVCGDAAFTCGVTLEALNNVVSATQRLIVILNDNEWSIARNVGAISRYLNRLSTNPTYNRIHHDVEAFFKSFPAGVEMNRVYTKWKRETKDFFVESSLFEKFGLRYLGPVDGHDLEALAKNLEFAKHCDVPVLVHVLTKKGRGLPAAVEHPERFHGASPFDPLTGEGRKAATGTPPNYQDVLGQALTRFAQADRNVVGITAAMPSGTSLKLLEQAVPGQYYDVGIAEEHAVIFAAGMATMGFRPVVAIYSTFLQRAYDCIHHDVCLQDLPVIFCMDRAGLSANDGPTHHGLFDISYLRCLPGIIGMAPANEDELQDMMFTATLQSHPVAIRYPRGNAEGVPIKEIPAMVPIGKAVVVENFANTQGSTRVALFGLGPMLTLARAAAMKLRAEGFDVAVINPRYFKPLDREVHEFYGKAADVVATLEDHVAMGGYGSAVLECLSEAGISTPMHRLAWPDQFVEHATTVDFLREKHGLTVDALVAGVKSIAARKSSSQPAAATRFA